MIVLSVCFVYLFLTRILTKYTPIFSTITWINASVLGPLGVQIKKLLSKKTQPQIIDDAFEIPVKDKKASNIVQKLADKGGDDIAKIITEVGKMFVDIDPRIIFIFSVLLLVFFITGIVQHIQWAIQYWQLTVVLFSLFIEFMAWTKKTAKPKNQTT